MPIARSAESSAAGRVVSIPWPSELFHQATGRFPHTKLFYEKAFLHTAGITALHLRWYGDYYKDMPISIDLVFCVALDNFEPHRKCTAKPCKYYVFCKQKNLSETELPFCPIAYTDQEQTMMKEFTANARQGLMLAKSLRLTRLITYECASRLTENVTDIHDTLKTYMLKTCLFILHQRLPDPTVELLPEQWALLIYEQLFQVLMNGYMPILFDVPVNNNISSLFNCNHDLGEMLKHDELRAACCDQRLDLLSIAHHLHSILHRHCQQINISVDHVFGNLPPYDRIINMLCAMH